MSEKSRLCLNCIDPIYMDDLGDGDWKCPVCGDEYNEWADYDVYADPEPPHTPSKDELVLKHVHHALGYVVLDFAKKETEDNKMSDPQPVDWKTLPPSPDLDRLIALHLGHEPFSPLAAPDGSWLNCFIQPEPDLPPVEVRYSRDDGEALGLLQSEPYIDWNLFTEQDEWITCELGHWSDDWHDDQVEHATEDTVAHAIVKALFAWWERPDHPAPMLPDKKD